MATLVGERLFNYLSDLQKEVSSITQSDKKSDYAGPHHCFAQVIEAEKLFLQKYYKNNNAKPSFAFSGNGLPSVDSLVSDLEAICELSDEDPVFKDVSLKFQKELAKIDKDNYSKATKKEYEKREKGLSKIDNKKTIVKSRFSLSETEDRTLELKLREETYIDGQDDHSKNFPIFIKESTTYYKMVFDVLMHHSKEDFLLYNTSMILPKSNLPEIKKEKIGLKITKAMAKTSQIMVKKSLVGVVGAAQFLYLQPTFFRKHLKGTGDEPASAVSGMVNLMISIPFFVFLGPYVALAPLATNSLSGLYEWYRYEKNKVLREGK